MITANQFKAWRTVRLGTGAVEIVAVSPRSLGFRGDAEASDFFEKVQMWLGFEFCSREVFFASAKAAKPGDELTTFAVSEGTTTSNFRLNHFDEIDHTGAWKTAFSNYSPSDRLPVDGPIMFARKQVA